MNTRSFQCWRIEKLLDQDSCTISSKTHNGGKIDAPFFCPQKYLWWLIRNGWQYLWKLNFPKEPKIPSTSAAAKPEPEPTAPSAWDICLSSTNSQHQYQLYQQYQQHHRVHGVQPPLRAPWTIPTITTTSSSNENCGTTSTIGDLLMAQADHQSSKTTKSATAANEATVLVLFINDYIYIYFVYKLNKCATKLKFYFELKLI